MGPPRECKMAQSQSHAEKHVAEAPPAPATRADASMRAGITNAGGGTPGGNGFAGAAGGSGVAGMRWPRRRGRRVWQRASRRLWSGALVAGDVAERSDSKIMRISNKRSKNRLSPAYLLVAIAIGAILGSLGSSKVLDDLNANASKRNTHQQHAIQKNQDPAPLQECPEEVTVIRGGLDPPLGQSGFGSYFFVELCGMIEDELNRNNTNFVIVPETDHRSSFFNRKGSVMENKWSRFFVPVNEHLLSCLADDSKTDSSKRKKMTRVRDYNYDMDIHLSRGRIKAWPYGDDDDVKVYGPLDELNEPWYRRNRQRGHAIASKYHIPQPALASHIDDLQQKLFRGKHPMLGIHMRGTDKLMAGGRKIINPADYIPFIRSFQTKFLNGGIFVATDDASMLQTLEEEHSLDFISQSILRSQGEETIPFIVDHPDGQDVLGVEIMTDIYLLSRCGYLLHGISSVIESVMYINVELHKNSINLEYSPRDGESYVIPWQK